MIALITGSAGFYGKHLSDELEENGYEVIRCDLKAEGDIISMDIMNSDMVLDIISQHRPDVLVNMAGQAKGLYLLPAKHQRHTPRGGAGLCKKP